MADTFVLVMDAADRNQRILKKGDVLLDADGDPAIPLTHVLTTGDDAEGQDITNVGQLTLDAGGTTYIQDNSGTFELATNSVTRFSVSTTEITAALPLHMGANGIGSDDEVLTFAAGATGAAAFAGALSAGGQFVATVDADSDQMVGRFLNDNAGSSAGAYIKIENDGSGDAYMVFNLTTPGVNWSVGVDNSDGDSFKIHNAATFASTGIFELNLTAMQFNPTSSSGFLSVTSTSASAGASAGLHLTVPNTSTTGDVYVRFFVDITTAWAIGIDNSDADKFKISESSTPGSSDALTFATTTRDATFGGNIFLGTNGIGRDNSVLTFAAGATGAATCAGNINMPEDGQIGISGAETITFDGTGNYITVSDSALFRVGTNTPSVATSAGDAYISGDFEVAGTIYTGLGGGGIGRNASVLTFATGSTGAATFAGEVAAAGLKPQVDTESTTPVTVDDTMSTILVNAGVGVIVVDLPALAAGNAGRIYFIKKIDASANAVTITPNVGGGDLIDGAVTYALSAQYDGVIIQSNGSTEWYILAAV